MSIDIGRLATDRAYWDSVAPEGAEALIDEEFVLWLGSIEFCFDGGEWVKEYISWPLSKYFMRGNFTVIMRPEATEQWIDGLPPVGADQTVFIPSTAISASGAESSDSRWEVVAHHGDFAVVCVDEFGRGSYRAFMILAGHCRPLRTPEQRERDAIIDIAFSKLSEFHDADQVLGELYDAGMLRKQED